MPKLDNLAGTKLLGYSYLQLGLIQAFAGMYTYFAVLSDYGFKPMTLFFYTNPGK